MSLALARPDVPAAYANRVCRTAIGVARQPLAEPAGFRMVSRRTGGGGTPRRPTPAGRLRSVRSNLVPRRQRLRKEGSGAAFSIVFDPMVVRIAGGCSRIRSRLGPCHGRDFSDPPCHVSPADQQRGRSPRCAPTRRDRGGRWSFTPAACGCSRATNSRAAGGTGRAGRGRATIR